MQQFTEQNFHSLCNGLAAKDTQLNAILQEFGYPPCWTRPNTFETLVLTILEQQVSLASAYAAFQRLKEKLPQITPNAILKMGDEELRSCSFSRQKMVYVRELASAICTGRINLEQMEKAEDEVVRKQLKALKGIGDWTVDIYLLHALQRTDIFPLGDLALINAIRKVNNAPLTKEEIAVLGEAWRPYRSIATMIFWNYYIRLRNITIQR